MYESNVQIIYTYRNIKLAIIFILCAVSFSSVAGHLRRRFDENPLEPSLWCGNVDTWRQCQGKNSILNYLKRKCDTNEFERQIDENGSVIIEPMFQMDVDKEKDEKNTTGYITGNDTAGDFWVKIQCEFCGCSIVKEKWGQLHRRTAHKRV